MDFEVGLVVGANLDGWEWRVTVGPLFANLQFGKGSAFKTVNQLPRSLWDDWRRDKIEALLTDAPSPERDLGVARSLRRLSAETNRPKRLT